MIANWQLASVKTRKGVSKWNAWRAKHGWFHLDIINFSQKGVTNHKTDLRGIDLSNTSIRNSSFENVDLRGADFNNSDIVDVNFESSLIGRANFAWSSIRRSNFNNSSLCCTNFDHVSITETQFQDTHLTCAAFSRSAISRSTIKSSNCSGADFYGSNLFYVIFDDVSLWNTGFNETCIDSTFFHGGNHNSLIGAAHFDFTELSNVIFYRYVLHCSQFYGAKMRHVIFQDNRLSSIEFEKSTISHSTFIGDGPVSCVLPPKMGFNACKMLNVNFIEVDSNTLKFEATDISDVLIHLKLSIGGDK